MVEDAQKASQVAEQVGRMLLFGWQGADAVESQYVNEHARALIDELAVGGVIVMGRNVGSPDQLRGVTMELQKRNREHGRPPLFIAVDQEGGRVNRLTPPDFTRQPSAKEIGDTGDPVNARNAAATIALELKSVGINWDFAPVLDVNNNPDNPVIGDRSYGSDPSLVARMGVAAVQGFQDVGVLLACGKHFPGHGDTNVDSHLALPVVSHSRTRMEQVELLPFRAAIAAGLGAIMTAHIMFSELDPELPVTLSPTILTGLLREEMGFDGIVITDSLEMKGVAEKWGPAEAAVLAVEAGADMLLCCSTLSTQRAIHKAVCEAVISGRVSQSRIEASAARIFNIKSRWLG